MISLCTSTVNWACGKLLRSLNEVCTCKSHLCVAILGGFRAWLFSAVAKWMVFIFVYTQLICCLFLLDILQVEIDIDSFVNSFRPDIMEAVYAWAKGSKFYEIMSVTGVFEGSLIRAIRRLEEVLQQLIHAANSIGETDLESKFEEAVLKIKRDIVFAASLYL